MKSASGRFAISCNGEVFNYRELAYESRLAELWFRSDTELVLRLFDKQVVNSLVQLARAGNGIETRCVKRADR